MTDLSQSTRQFPKIDGAFAAIIVIYVCVALFLPAEFGATLGFMANAMTSTAPFIIFAVLAVIGWIIPLLFMRGDPVYCGTLGCWRPPWRGNGVLAILPVDGPCDVRHHQRNIGI